MEKLFTYGSLQQSDIQEKLFNRTLSGVLDVLVGYEKAALEIGGKKFNIANPNPESKIDGIVYEMSKAELERADRYEGKGYGRIKVVLLSGTETWLYMRV